MKTYLNLISNSLQLSHPKDPYLRGAKVRRKLCLLGVCNGHAVDREDLDHGHPRLNDHQSDCLLFLAREYRCNTVVEGGECTLLLTRANLWMQLGAREDRSAQLHVWRDRIHDGFVIMVPSVDVDEQCSEPTCARGPANCDVLGERSYSST